MKTIVILLSLFWNPGLCKDFIAIDKKDFDSSKISTQTIVQLSKVMKSGHSLKVTCKDTTYLFNDIFSKELDAYHLTYKLLGTNTNKQWTLVQGTDENRNYFYLVNLTSGKIDTLLGLPIMYDDRVLCLEGAYTDGGNKIEIWEIRKNEIFKIKTMNLHKCEIYDPYQIYLLDNSVYISTTSNNYYRADI